MHYIHLVQRGIKAKNGISIYYFFTVIFLQTAACRELCMPGRDNVCVCVCVGGGGGLSMSEGSQRHPPPPPPSKATPERNQMEKT